MRWPILFGNWGGLRSAFTDHSRAKTNLDRHRRDKRPTQPSRGKILAVREGRGVCQMMLLRMNGLKNSFVLQKPRSLHGPEPFCHLRLFFSRNRKSRTAISPRSSP